MISLIGNKWCGYTLTREYDAFNDADARQAFAEARDKIQMGATVNHASGSDIPTTPFERLCKQHGLL